MAEYSGSCLCRAVTFVIKGEFDRFYLCHCQHCQKDTGSAHAANLFSQSARLTWLSGHDHITTFTLPGTRHTKSFCQTCGSAVPNTHQPNVLVVPAGCLDTPVSLPPNAHIFTGSKAKWDQALEQVVAFEGLPE